MKSEIVPSQTPEELELDKKKGVLADLEVKLTESELALATLQAELHSFESRYMKVVGVRYAELDEIVARIAEALAKRNPIDQEAQEMAANTRARAKESAKEASDARESKERAKFVPSDRLKKLYREIAKSIHPDLTTDETERKRRTELMAKANQAYENGEEKSLENILREWKSSPDSVKGEGTAADLVRVIRKIAQVEERLQTIQSQTNQIISSDLYELKTKVEEAELSHRDLLGEMGAEIAQQILEAKGRLSTVSAV